VIYQPPMPTKQTEFKKPEYKKPAEAAKPVVSANVIVPEKEPVVEKQDYSDLRKIMKEKFPEQILLDHPPSDEKAMAIKLQWKNEKLKPDLIFIVGEVREHQKTFLDNLCKAIKIVLNKNAQVADKAMVADVIELNDIDLYFREPSRKAELWKRII
jgi:hypothetical protein